MGVEDEAFLGLIGILNLKLRVVIPFGFLFQLFTKGFEPSYASYKTWSKGKYGLLWSGTPFVFI